MASRPRLVDTLIESEVSALANYFDVVIEWRMPTPNKASLLHAFAAKGRYLFIKDLSEFPDLSSNQDDSILVVLDGVINYHPETQMLLQEIYNRVNRSTRIAIIGYNSYLRPIYRLANRLGIRKGPVPQVFLTRNSLTHIAKLSRFETLSLKPFCIIPVSLLGLERAFNWIIPLLPGIRWLSVAALISLRPIRGSTFPHRISIVVPARNEQGNIENLVRRLLPYKEFIHEVIFVEGHSTDTTWPEINKICEKYGNSLCLKAYRQAGKGKNDAVRYGFQLAEGDLLAILDADLSTEPETLRHFLEAYDAGHGDFINGNRMIFPMEDGAMQPLNFLGNLFFAKALSSVLSVSIGDSLCGTKLVAKRDYLRAQRWCRDFGDFDPFGDFELLFPAAVLKLGIVDIPVAYRARTYGTTNISRFYHGLMLLKMTLIGLFRIKPGKLRCKI